MKIKSQNSHRHKTQTTRRKSLPISGIILVILLLSTFLTVLVAEQQQESRSKAQTTEPIQQACLPGSNLTPEEANKLEPFCNVESETGICKDFCKRTSDAGGNSNSALCQPGGVFHCEAAAGATEKGKCQQGACATTARTGTDSFCGGGGTCCEPPHPLGGSCGKPADCVAGLVCTNGLCSNPPPPPGPTQDLDSDGKQNDMDDDIDGDGILNPQDPDVDNDGQPNEQDQEPNGAPGAVPPPAAPAPNVPGGGGGAPDRGAACPSGQVRNSKGVCYRPVPVRYPVNSNTACQPNATAPAIRCDTANGYTCKSGFCTKTPTVACIQPGQKTTSSSRCCKGIAKSYPGIGYVCD